MILTLYIYAENMCFVLTLGDHFIVWVFQIIPDIFIMQFYQCNHLILS